MKQKIIDYLKDKGVYDETHEHLIDALLKQIKMANKTYEQMGTKYVVQSSSNAGESTKVNPLFTMHQSATAKIESISKTLLLSAQELAKLKLIKEKADLITENFHKS